MIVLRNVSKSFISASESVDVLRDVSISVERGQFVSVIGPSGSGKTTLLQIMGLLEVPTDGEIMIEGRKVNKLSKKERMHLRRNKISYVFQQYQLLPALTAIENVMLPVLQFKKNREVIKRAVYLLEQVVLSHRKNHIPAKLSGGEQQRIAIARALMTNPDVILADEMTGNLDEETAEQIMELFQKIHQSEKKTIIIVTHNLDLINYTEVSYQLRNGMLTKVGTVHSIKQDVRT